QSKSPSRSSFFQGPRHDSWSSVVMSRLSRRQLVRGALGLSVAGAGGLLLHPQAHATPASGTLGTYADFLVREAKGVLPDVPKSPGQLVATEDNILGPYY